MSLKTIRTFFSAAAALLLLIGCGGEESKQEPPKAAEQPAAAEAPKGAEGNNNIVEDMSPDGKAMHITATQQDGKKFQAGIGEEVEIPEQFPKDIPVYPDSKPMAFLYSPDEGVLVTFKTTDDQQAVYDYYQTSLAKDGWDVQPTDSSNNQLAFEANKGNRKVSITVGGRTGDSRVSVIVTTEK